MEDIMREVTVTDNGSKLTVTINIADDAQTDSRSMTVTNPDCSTATKAEAITITPKGER
jgi:hypothetical protein